MILLMLLGCPPRPAPPVAPAGPADPAAVLDFARREPAPGPTAGTFSIRITTPDDHVSAAGSVVVAPPDAFRMEVHGPIGGPALVVASDGKALRAWQAGKNVFFDGADTDARIREVTGGITGLDGVASLLLGRLPALGDPAEMSAPDNVPRYVWTRSDGSSLTATLDARSAHLRGFEAKDADGKLWIAAVYAPDTFPKEVHFTLPTIGATADLEFSSWAAAKPDPAVFTLTAPPGATVKSLEVGAQPAQSPQ